MIGQENHVEELKSLAPAALEQAVTKDLTDGLQELVASIERHLPLGGNTLHGCVVDEFQIRTPLLTECECRVPLRFNASARQGVGASAQLERIAGRAEAVIDAQGRVSYRHVHFGEEPAFLPHDLGGGD